jgi:hypothetical protein
VPLVLAGVEGPVECVAVDVDEGAVDDHERRTGSLRVGQSVADAWGAGGEERDGLPCAAPSGGGRDAEAGREVAQSFAFAQVGEGEQGLLSGVKCSPAGADGLAVCPNEGGDSVEGRGGQRQCGSVEQHEGSWWRTRSR